jgi:hypothetical protein
LNGRKLSVAALAGLVSIVLAVALSGGSAAAAKDDGSGLSIRVWPKGLFGYVNASDRCAVGRRVVVFEQDGDDGRGDDRKVASAKAGEGKQPQWAVKAGGAGTFYAVAAKSKGCPALVSKVVQVLPQGSEPNASNGDYPPCGPYVSEGPTAICKFEKVYAKLDQEAAFKSCKFDRSSGSCPGYSKSGTYPWGAPGRSYSMRWYWNWSNHQVQFVVFRDGDTGVAHLGGTMPSSGSPRFSISDGFATNDDKGYPNGDHFYTPDLPGAAAGEVGGPLYVNFVGGSWDETGAELYIDGYLYLKR